METVRDELNAAAILYKQGMYSEAIDLLLLALEGSPHEGKLWELAGLAYDASGQLSEASHSLEMASMLVPLSAGGQCVLARCYGQAGHRELAREMYRHLLSLPNIPDRLWPLIAAGLGTIGDYALALESCRRSAALELDSGEPLFGMAHYMELLGYPLNMICSVLRSAVDLEPERVAYRIALAKAYQQLGRTREAYLAARPLGIEGIRKVRCVNCLRKIYEVFQAMGDEAFSEACRERYQEIDTEV